MFDQKNVIKWIYPRQSQIGVMVLTFCIPNTPDTRSYKNHNVNSDVNNVNYITQASQTATKQEHGLEQQQ
jgi:hypothetical protein